MKHIFSILLLFFFISCNNGKVNPLSISNVEKQRDIAIEELARLASEGVLTTAGKDLIVSRLKTDCDTFIMRLKAGKVFTCDELNDMGTRTAHELSKSIKMNDEVFSNIALVYTMMCSGNQAPDLSVLNIGPYCSVAENMWQWYESRKTMNDKLESVRNRVKRFVTDVASDKSITLKQADVIASEMQTDIDCLAADTLMSQDELTKIVEAGLNRYDGSGYSNEVLTDIIYIYYMLASTKDVNMSQFVQSFTDRNFKMPEAPTYQDMRSQVIERLDWMRSENLVSKSDYNVIKTCMLDDIDTFIKGSQSQEQLKNRIEKSLSKMVSIPLDTEDREFICGIYYNLAENQGFDVSEMLNEWLYGEKKLF